MSDNTPTLESFWPMLYRDAIHEIFLHCELDIIIELSLASRFFMEQTKQYILSLGPGKIIEYGTLHGKPKIIRLGLGRNTTDDLVADAYVRQWTSIFGQNKFYQICQIAAQLEHIAMIEFACKNVPAVAETNGDHCYINVLAMDAAEYGQIPIIEWARTINPDYALMDKCAYIAGMHGKIEVLKWIITTGHVFSYTSYDVLIFYNNLEILRLMRKCPTWNPEFCRELAIEHGRGNILNWLTNGEN
jgi:hypothetical protein